MAHSSICSFFKSTTLVFTILFFGTVTAFAGGSVYYDDGQSITRIDEIRIGVLAHDVEDDSSSEDGVDINLEILFGRPNWRHRDSFIDRLIRPRPHIGGNINTAEETSMFYFGLTWDYKLSERWFFESSFGGAVHNGPLNAAGDSYGCKVNFRESATLGLKVDDHWRIMVTADHMSNADICSRNAGLTNVGVRLGYQY